MPRPIRATISAAALAHNLTVAQRHAGGRQGLGGAQGERLRPRRSSARRARWPPPTASRCSTSRRRCACAPPAWRKPILMLEGFFKPADLAAAAEARADAGDPQPGAGRDAQAQPARRRDRRLPQGEQRHEPPRASASRACARPTTRCACTRRCATSRLMTHFADADGAGGVQAQLEWFERADQALRGCTAARSPTRRRCCASRRARGDWVRPGIMLYGCSPFADQSAEQLGLKPAMTLSSEIIAIAAPAAGRARRLRLLLRGGRAR